MSLLIKILAVFGFLMAGYALWQQKDIRSTILGVLRDEPEVVSESTLEGFERMRKRSVEEGRSAQKAKIVEKTPDLCDEKCPFIGNPKGPIVITEFMDFRCGYCRSAAEGLAEILQKNPDVRINIRFLPILGDESAKISVYALLAYQAGKFNEFYKRMMKAVFPDEVTALDILSSLGIKTKTPAAEKKRDEIAKEIISNTKLAQDLEISATPSFVVGDEIVVGAQMDEITTALQKMRDSLQTQGNTKEDAK